MTYLIFTNEQDAIDCEHQISLRGSALMLERDPSLSRNEEGYVVIKEGKQPIEKWADVSKSFVEDKWSFVSPKSRSPEDFAHLVEGFTFDEEAVLPEDWFPPVEEYSPYV